MVTNDDVKAAMSAVRSSIASAPESSGLTASASYLLDVLNQHFSLRRVIDSAIWSTVNDAQRFVAGFEGDEMQDPPVDDLLHRLRALTDHGGPLCDFATPAAQMVDLLHAWVRVTAPNTDGRSVTFTSFNDLAKLHAETGALLAGLASQSLDKILPPVDPGRVPHEARELFGQWLQAIRWQPTVAPDEVEALDKCRRATIAYLTATATHAKATGGANV